MLTDPSQLRTESVKLRPILPELLLIFCIAQVVIFDPNWSVPLPTVRHGRTS